MHGANGPTTVVCTQQSTSPFLFAAGLSNVARPNLSHWLSLGCQRLLTLSAQLTTGLPFDHMHDDGKYSFLGRDEISRILTLGNDVLSSPAGRSINIKIKT